MVTGSVGGTVRVQNVESGKIVLGLIKAHVRVIMSRHAAWCRVHDVVDALEALRLRPFYRPATTHSLSP